MNIGFKDVKSITKKVYSGSKQFLSSSNNHLLLYRISNSLRRGNFEHTAKLLSQNPDIAKFFYERREFFFKHFSKYQNEIKAIVQLYELGKSLRAMKEEKNEV